MKKFLSIIFFVAIAMCSFAAPSAKEFVVVIDPGHGGKDFGAIGDITNEKTINLRVAKMLGDKISKSIDNVKVVYTRSTDVFIPLNDRATIANRAKGDLFISIHVNSVDRRSKNRRSVAGAEVYTLGLHRSDDNLSVARRENSVIMLEADHSETYKGFDPNSIESYIAFELNQSMHMDRSLRFAAAAEQQLITTAGRADKGVRQAGFWVLWATSMPAVLVELDFICNPTSERFLASDDGVDKLSTALYNAFADYHASVTGQSRPAAEQPHVADQPSSTATEASTDVVTQSVSNEKSEADTPTFTPAPGQAEYRVQILASDKSLSPSATDFKGVTGYEVYTDRGLYKYTMGHFPSQEAAAQLLKQLKTKFPTAFIIKMVDGVRIYE